MLSFGEEVEEDEKESEAANVKIKSIHDVLDDPRFIKGDVDARNDGLLVNPFLVFYNSILAKGFLIIIS